MMRRLLLAVALALLILLAPSTVHADVNNFTITKFTADETLSRTDKQGTLHVRERIEVVFTDFNHGILRAIPTSYRGQSLKLHINSVQTVAGAASQYTTYQSNGNTVLKIGDPNRTVTGKQTYLIDYTMQNVIAFFGSHDELYWDVNGDQWDQPTAYVKVTLHLPSDAKLASVSPVCYAGANTHDSSRCTIERQGDKVTATAAALGSRETLTYVVGFNKGYFSPQTLLERVQDHLWQLVTIVGLPLLSLLAGFTWWWRKGRDAPGRGTIMPEYEPPKAISPIEAGAITDFRVDNRDITATIIDLARRGYIKIIETHEDRLILKDKLSYTLELLRADVEDLTIYERTLLTAIFKTMTVHESVKLADLKNDLYSTANDLRKAVSLNLTTLGYFRQDPKKFLWKLGSLFSIVYVGIFLIGFANQLHAVAALVGVIISVIILALFARIIPARTEKGVAAREQLLGLKMYMETAEKDRLQMLEVPNARYATNAGEPVRTVELFEKLLPYAIVMGVEKEWADQFKNIYSQPPEWYNGNITSFNAGYLAGSLNSGFNSAVNASFSPPSNSGSSGFGGGFSGGGGGGGGGGGW
jgi:uncharacterized membrane protein